MGSRSTLLFIAGLIGSGVLSGCNDDCTRASDCPVTDICFRGVCTPSTSEYLTCTSDEQCNASGGAQLECVASRCRVRESGAGAPDASTRDAGGSSDGGPFDSGGARDSGPPIFDSGAPPDSGAPADSGPPIPDAGLPMDGGASD